MTWVITGGAGYIGSHVVRAMRESGRTVVVLDDLSSGHREFVEPGVALVEGSIVDPVVVRKTLGAAAGLGGLDGVIHLAGFKYAGVSVQRPIHTFEQNVTGTAVLLEGMLEAGCKNMVFSSSAACFGTPDVDLVTEATPTNPESPYGQSKLFGEWLLRDLEVSDGLRHTSLRYFNVVGSGYPDLYDTSPHNLFPKVLAAVGAGETPIVFGTDYATPDGSCVRDYVHVQDIALAHVAAAARLETGQPLERVYNLGSGDGVSVLQIMDAVARVTGRPFTPEVRERRPGDPARIVASGELARRDLDWTMRHDLDDMVASAWSAWTASRA
ncbi:UDP-glucose 4-epimerase GalE [Spongisporangium articulatum]|uniref:UDP-glucose 4-epimerase n=1 Tax=Spongisporangium articulatum TaxID=3362603 RepID=A0ABW8APP0_9ACTN